MQTNRLTSFRAFAVFSGLIATQAALSAGCGSDDSSAFLSEVIPLVDKASPSTFQVTAVQLSRAPSRLMATPADAAEALKDFFTDSVNSISGLTGKGLIRTYLKDLDKRVQEINSMEEPGCFASTPVSVAFEVGTGSQSLTAKFSCVRKFGGAGDQAGEGSGLAFGQDETYKYLYLLLIQSNGTDKFGYVAKINKSTEEVDLLFLSYFPSYSRNQFFRLRTTPATKRYEVLYAGTGDSVGPSQTSTTHVLAPGARIVTSESEIRADGKVGTSTNGSGVVSGEVSFDNTECFSSSNLSTAAAACTASAPTFSSDMTLVTSADMAATAVGTALSGSLKTMSAIVTLGATEVAN